MTAYPRAIAALALVLALLVSTDAFSEGERLALVIGIDGYQTLGELETCRNDAKALAQALLDSEGYSEEFVVLLTDDASQPQNRPTLATMRRRIEQVALLAGPEDSILFFFSGHGVARDEEGYLIPMDGDPSNAIPLSWVKQTLAGSRAQSKLLILDACHAGSAAKGVAGIAPSLLVGADLSMILASAADQVSYPDPESGKSVFTRFLVEGLGGKADINNDKLITQGELYEHVKRQMTIWSLKSGKVQTPLALPEALASHVLARIPEAPLLFVKAVDVKTGQEISGADVLLDGKKVGATPLSGYKLTKGSRTVEVKGEKLEPYRQVIVVTRDGRYEVVGELEPITVRVPPGFRASPGTQTEPYTGTGWAKEIIHGKTGMEMVFIPAGEFMMGSPTSEKDRSSDEGPVHRVRITKPFYMGKYEVSQGQWQAVMGNNPSAFKGSDKLPVERVSWNDSQVFLGKAGDGLRLPTEAEWEYACRAGTNTPFYFGNTITTDQVNYDGNYPYAGGPKGVYRQKTTPVGSFPPNAWELYDMHGNVWEWCEDWDEKDYYGQSPGSDPTGPGSGSYRVVRGGSWNYDAYFCRSANRDGIGPSYSNGYVGFRAALGLP